MESKQRQLTVAILETKEKVPVKFLKEKLDSSDCRVITLYSNEQKFESHFEARKVDYYLLDDLKKALKDVDVVYLPASLPRPQARLVQADHEDLILLLKDNFEMAQSSNGLQKVIYPTKTLSLTKLPLTSENTVFSIQRYQALTNHKIEWVVQEYMSWISRFLFPFLKVTQKEGYVFLSLFIQKFKLLVLKHSLERSSDKRQVFSIEGGLLSLKNTQGLLEFRMVQSGEEILAFIYNYKPRLPWIIYRISQAIIHKFVMKSFGRHLKKVNKNASK